jgi:hypothetical protein
MTTMRVFFSWSGEQSRALAAALRDYIPLVVQSVEPWFSPEDIDKGARWLSDLGLQLEQQSVAVICLTPASITSPWLLYEVGALSRTLDTSWVCPVLLGIEPAEVTGPLAQFQATRLTKSDIRRLLGTMNRRCDFQLTDVQIDRLHDLLWPDLEKTLDGIVKARPPAPSLHRTQAEMLAELLERMRSLERQLALTPAPQNVSAGTLQNSLPDLIPSRVNSIAKIDRALIDRNRVKQRLEGLEHALSSVAPEDDQRRRNLEVEVASARARLMQSDDEMREVKELMDGGAPSDA